MTTCRRHGAVMETQPQYSLLQWPCSMYSSLTVTCPHRGEAGATTLMRSKTGTCLLHGGEHGMIATAICHHPDEILLLLLLLLLVKEAVARTRGICLLLDGAVRRRLHQQAERSVWGVMMIYLHLVDVELGSHHHRRSLEVVRR